MYFKIAKKNAVELVSVFLIKYYSDVSCCVGTVWALWRGLFARQIPLMKSQKLHPGLSSVSVSAHTCVLPAASSAVVVWWWVEDFIKTTTHTHSCLRLKRRVRITLRRRRRRRGRKVYQWGTDSSHQSDKQTSVKAAVNTGQHLAMGNNVSGLSMLQRGQQQGFHRLRNSHKGQ